MACLCVASLVCMVFGRSREHAAMVATLCGFDATLGFDGEGPPARTRGPALRVPRSLDAWPPELTRLEALRAEVEHSHILGQLCSVRCPRWPPGSEFASLPTLRLVCQRWLNLVFNAASGTDIPLEYDRWLQAQTVVQSHH